VQIARDESGRILKLSGAVQINAADELRAALLDFVRTASRPVVDLAEVTECDIAAVQLLISAGRTAGLSAKPFEFAGLSAAVRQAGAALGVSFAELPANAVAGRPQDAVGAQPASRGSEDAI
jgi:anti-anti-sigma regulatory factor